MTMKLKYNFRLVGLSLMLFLAFNTGCYYDQVYVAPEDIPDLGPDPVSFAAEIQPIFTAKCTTCHPPTKQLDLLEGNAYASINNTTYINSGTPAESLIYTKPAPTGSHSEKYTTTEAAIVLKWIEEGAQNN